MRNKQGHKCENTQTCTALLNLNRRDDGFMPPVNAISQPLKAGRQTQTA